MELSFNAIDDALKCSLCNRPLSVPPIFHNESLGNTCGRCVERVLSLDKNEGSVSQRQNIYENIAKFLSFPCAYYVLGCKTKLKWNSVLSHEEMCPFKKIVCPISLENCEEQCNWIDDHSQLVDHLKRDHKKFFCNPLQITLFRQPSNEILFWEITGHLVLIILNYKKELNMYYCCIAADLSEKECAAYEYQIEICCGDWKNPVILRRNKLEPMYGNTSARPDNSIEVDLNQLADFSKQSNENTMKFTIIKKNYEDIGGIQLTADFSLNRTKNFEINEDLLHDLECPVCVDFMMPPIYICQAGHNVCNNCHGKVTVCPICRGSMLGGRNFTLEKLTATINYPCVNRVRGCGFVALIEKVKQHEKNCLLTEGTCFLPNCNWKGANIGLLIHFEEDHQFLQLNQIHRHSLEKKVDKYIFKFDNRIFILKMRFEINQPFEYVLLCYGGEEAQYKYELQIIGSLSADIKVTLCHLCQSQPYNVERKDVTEFTGISIPFAFLSQFMIHFNRVDFKINIEKINN